jgi:hypothetical protein
VFRLHKRISRNPRMLEIVSQGHVTDGLNSYKQAFNSEFYDHHLSCTHIADVALQDSLNNMLERMHGSIRNARKL